MTPNPTSHADRVRFDLDETRDELKKVVQELTPDELDWSPRPDLGMKSFKALLQEIGAMEAASAGCLIKGGGGGATEEAQESDWMTVTQRLDKGSVAEILAGLDDIRKTTLAYLDRSTDESLNTPLELPESWRQYFGGKTHVEPLILLSWIVRHEYYHLGQIVIYQWQRGKMTDPI